MNTFFKWLGIAACGIGSLAVIDRINTVRAAEDRPSYERAGDGTDRLDRIADKLDRLLERMDGRMGPGGPPHDGPHREGPPRDRPEWGGPPRMPREMSPEMRELIEQRMHEGRERMEKARGEIKERMEKAKERFEQLESRVKTLEAEVERLKAGK